MVENLVLFSPISAYMYRFLQIVVINRLSLKPKGIPKSRIFMRLNPKVYNSGVQKHCLKKIRQYKGRVKKICEPLCGYILAYINFLI